MEFGGSLLVMISYQPVVASNHVDDIVGVVLHARAHNGAWSNTVDANAVEGSPLDGKCLGHVDNTRSRSTLTISCAK